MSPVQVDSSTSRTYQSISRSKTAQTPQQKENTAQFLPTTPIMEREPDTELFYTAGRPKSQDNTLTSCHTRMVKFARCKGTDTKEFIRQNSLSFYRMWEAILLAIAQFGKHMMRDHYKELSMKRHRQKLVEI